MIPTFERLGGVPQLRRCVVLFLDALGTSEYATGVHAQSTLQSLDAAFVRARERSGVDEAYDWFHASWFSDNLAVCAPLHATDRGFQEFSLGFTITMTIWLQYVLAIEGFFTRGGMTVGEQYSDESITFGPALVEAVRVEQAAHFPRVVLTASAIDLVDDHFKDHFSLSDNPFHHHLMSDDQGVTFLSYLGAILEADDLEEMIDLACRHRDAVALQLASHAADADGRVRHKYEWTAGYHNSFCALYLAEYPDLLIPGVATGHFVPYEPVGSGTQ